MWGHSIWLHISNQSVLILHWAGNEILQLTTYLAIGKHAIYTFRVYSGRGRGVDDNGLRTKISLILPSDK